MLTFPRTKRLLLIFAVSLSMNPSLLLSLRRSLPARSTKQILPEERGDEEGTQRDL